MSLYDHMLMNRHFYPLGRQIHAEKQRWPQRFVLEDAIVAGTVFSGVPDENLHEVYEDVKRRIVWEDK